MTALIFPLPEMRRRRRRKSRATQTGLRRLLHRPSQTLRRSLQPLERRGRKEIAATLDRLAFPAPATHRRAVEPVVVAAETLAGLREEVDLDRKDLKDHPVLVVSEESEGRGEREESAESQASPFEARQDRPERSAFLDSRAVVEREVEAVEERRVETVVQELRARWDHLERPDLAASPARAGDRATLARLDLQDRQEPPPLIPTKFIREALVVVLEESKARLDSPDLLGHRDPLDEMDMGAQPIATITTLEAGVEMLGRWCTRRTWTCSMRVRRSLRERSPSPSPHSNSSSASKMAGALSSWRASISRSRRLPTCRRQ